MSWICRCSRSAVRCSSGVSVQKRFKRRGRRDPPPSTQVRRPAFNPDFARYTSPSAYNETDDYSRSIALIKPPTQTPVNIDDDDSALSPDALDGDIDESDQSDPSKSYHKYLSQFSIPQIIPRTPAAKVLSAQSMYPIEATDKDSSPIEIIAEDEAYIFVFKPAGVAVHGNENLDGDPLPTNRKKRQKSNKKARKDAISFYDAFLHHWWTTHPFNRFQPGLLHRLDKGVSGVMVFAKRWSAQRHFLGLAHGNAEYTNGCGIKKCYIAAVQGVPPQREGIIEGHIHKTFTNYKRYSIYPLRSAKKVIEKGQYCHTEYRVVDSCEHGKFGVVSLVCFTISTGRRQQIRATASALGTPIIGDSLYGGPHYNQLMLHSLFVGFEGVADTELLYAVSAMPKWTHLRHNIWTTRAQYQTKEHVDLLMKVPRPPKKPKMVDYSLKKERMEMAREAAESDGHVLLPFSKEESPALLTATDESRRGLDTTSVLSDDDESLSHLDDDAYDRHQNRKEKSKALLDVFVKDQLAKGARIGTYRRASPKEFETWTDAIARKSKSGVKKSKKHDLLSGAVPEHFQDEVY